MFLEFVLFVLLIITLLFLFCKHPPGMPPGPYQLPILGSGMPFNESACLKNREKYGDIFTVKMGNAYFVTLCDYKVVKDTFSKLEVSSRPVIEMLKKINKGEFKGLIQSNGAQWNSTRRFVLRQLRDQGMGKSFLEDSVQSEVKEMSKEFEKLAGKETDLPLAIKYAALNIIWQMVAGKRYDYDNANVTKLDDIAQKFQENAKLSYLPEFLPILNFLFPGPIGRYIFKYKSMEDFFVEYRKEITPFIEEHKEKKNPSNDLISEYLLEMEDPANSEDFFTEEDLCQTVMDLFSAGSDTVYNTVRWSLIYLAKYPEVQKKVQEEIDQVVDRDHLPGQSDKHKLPYTEAMIHEVLRKSSLVNFGVPRVANEDIQIGDYSIPKGTMLVSAAYFIHHDPRYWECPEEFKPERFLDEEGKFNSPQEGFLPFGIGRRQCIGEALAKTELFLFLTALLQKFTFAPAPGQEIDMGVAAYMSGRVPKPQKIIFNLRE